MPHDRFYVEAPLSLGDEIILKDEEHHHLSRVMRVRVGEEIECFNGKGFLALAEVISSEKKESLLVVHKSQFVDKTKCPLVIAQAYPRQNKLDLILEKGTELGMSAIYLFPGDHSEKHNSSDNQKIRMQHLLINACKQCGQLWLPEVVEMPALSKWQDLPYEGYFGDVRDHAPHFESQWKGKPTHKGAIFFVGPEKGFSDNEERTLEKVGAIGVKLHPHILRTETAPLAALSLMSHWLMSST